MTSSPAEVNVHRTASSAVTAPRNYVMIFMPFSSSFYSLLPPLANLLHQAKKQYSYNAQHAVCLTTSTILLQLICSCKYLSHFLCLFLVFEKHELPRTRPLCNALLGINSSHIGQTTPPACPPLWLCPYFLDTWTASCPPPSDRWKLR